MDGGNTAVGDGSGSGDSGVGSSVVSDQTDSNSTSTAYPSTATSSTDTRSISSDCTSSTLTADSGLGSIQSHLDSLPKMDMIELLLQYDERGRTQERDVKVREQETVADLKRTVQEVTHLHPGQQALTLCYQGNRFNLDDDRRTICQYGVSPRCRARIEVRAKTRAGGGGLV